MRENTHRSDQTKGRIDRKDGRDVHHMNLVKMLEFPQRGDERGHLVIVEGE